MRIITVPATVEAELRGQKLPFTFKEFLMAHLDAYAEVKTVSMVRQVSKVAEVIEKATDTMSFEDADYNLVKAACDKVALVPALSRQVVSYWDAVEKAEEVKK